MSVKVVFLGDSMFIGSESGDDGILQDPMMLVPGPQGRVNLLPLPTDKLEVLNPAAQFVPDNNFKENFEETVKQVRAAKSGLVTPGGAKVSNINPKK